MYCLYFAHRSTLHYLRHPGTPILPHNLTPSCSSHCPHSSAPGKPLTFATLEVPPPTPGAPSRRMWVFGLPGNPVSSFACFNLITLPAIRKLSGWAQPELRRVQVRGRMVLRWDAVRWNVVWWDVVMDQGMRNEMLLGAMKVIEVGECCSRRVGRGIKQLKVCLKPAPPSSAISPCCVKVRLTQDLKLDPERPEYHRATLQWSLPPTNCRCEHGVGSERDAWGGCLTVGKGASVCCVVVIEVRRACSRISLHQNCSFGWCGGRCKGCGQSAHDHEPGCSASVGAGLRLHDTLGKDGVEGPSLDTFASSNKLTPAPAPVADSDPDPVAAVVAGTGGH